MSRTVYHPSQLIPFDTPYLHKNFGLAAKIKQVSFSQCVGAGVLEVPPMVIRGTAWSQPLHGEVGGNATLNVCLQR